MKVSEYAAMQIAAFATSAEYKNGLSGPQMVDFFNRFGFEDVYSSEFGLPKLFRNQDFNTTRKNYMANRLHHLREDMARGCMSSILEGAADRQAAIDKFNSVFKSSGYHAVEENGSITILGGIIDSTTPIVNTAHFAAIEQEVLRALDEAKLMIWIAMAWFTNDSIYQKLLQKKAEGVKVILLIFNDGVNRQHGVDLSPFDHKLVRGSRGGIMHNKFAVVDNQFVITGSYNWSTNAETRNDENVTILRDTKRATEYSLEFKRLYTGV